MKYIRVFFFDKRSTYVLGNEFIVIIKKEHYPRAQVLNINKERLQVNVNLSVDFR